MNEWDDPLHDEPGSNEPMTDQMSYLELKKAEVEALHRYGERMFGDAWWPGRSRKDHSPEDAAVLDELSYFEARGSDD